jgi:hypothetical protein
MRERYSSKPEIPMPIQVSFQVGDDPKPATGWIARLSVAGVDIVGVDGESLQKHAVGTPVAFKVTFDPDSSESFALKGKLQWVNEGRVGIQFAELGVRETQAILQAMTP